MYTLRRIVFAAALPACFACAHGAGRGGSARGIDLNIITREQIRELDVRTAYDVVERLRPRWLTVRGGPRSFQTETEVVVFQDEAYLGNQDVLLRMGTEGIYSIRYLDGTTASATLPGMSSRHVAGAIIISMRPGEIPNSSGT